MTDMPAEAQSPQVTADQYRVHLLLEHIGEQAKEHARQLMEVNLEHKAQIQGKETEVRQAQESLQLVLEQQREQEEASAEPPE